MDTRTILVAAALKVLEEEGVATFSTRAVLAIANVSAPTLYHHFGNADGLLSAALAEAFSQFLASKQTATRSTDPIVSLVEGWDDYVQFAARRPRLYAAMLSRVLQGAEIKAAQRSFAVLLNQLVAVEATGRLAVPLDVAADRMWASANAASLLHVTARIRNVPPPSEIALIDLRDAALAAIILPADDRNS